MRRAVALGGVARPGGSGSAAAVGTTNEHRGRNTRRSSGAAQLAAAIAVGGPASPPVAPTPVCAGRWDVCGVGVDVFSASALCGASFGEAPRVLFTAG